MRKWIVVLGIVTLVVVGAVALIVVNLNSYLNENREWVAGKAETALGRSVSFGEVGISLLGGLGVRVADLRIGDDPAFSKEPFVSADVVDLRVAILPALLGNIAVDHVVLRSPAISVVQTARGLSTDSLGRSDGAAKPADDAAEEAEIPAFVVARVDVSDGTLRFRNQAATPAGETIVEKLDFRASNVSLTGPIDFEIDAAVLGASRQNIRISGQLVDLKDPKADFTLSSGALELAAGEGGAPGDVVRDLEITGQLSLPKAGPHVRATVRSSRGTIAGADYADLAADVALQNQVATIEKLGAALFGGQIEVNGRYDMRNAKRPRFDVQTTLASMRLEKVLASRSPKSAQAMQGELGGNLALAGTGSEWEQIKPTLTGKGSVQLVDGTLKDVNLADTALKGVTGVPGLSNLLPPDLRNKYPGVFGVGDTVFENMNTQIDIRDSWAYFRDFRLAARDYAISGQGRYSLDNKLDMSSVMTFSQPLSDHLVKAAAPMEYLRSPEGRVAFPVKLVGAAPGIKAVPDVSYIAQAASRQAVGTLIEKALGGKQQPVAGDAAGEPAAPDSATDLLKRGLGGLLKK